MSSIGGTSMNVSQLGLRLSKSWPAISQARSDTQAKRAKLEQHFSGGISPDTSLVAFGSVAREEVTVESDLDWILLIDGQSVPEHKEQERVIDRMLTKHGFVEPGASGVFGKMVGSHDLVHNIGGEDDFEFEYDQASAIAA